MISATNLLQMIVSTDNGFTLPGAGDIAVNANVHVTNLLKNKLGLSPHDLAKVLHIWDSKYAVKRAPVTSLLIADVEVVLVAALSGLDQPYSLFCLLGRSQVVSGNTWMLSLPIEKLERLLSFYSDVLRFSAEELRSLVRVKG